VTDLSKRRSSRPRSWIPLWVLLVAAVLVAHLAFTTWRLQAQRRDLADLAQRAAQEQLRAQALDAERQPYQQGLRIVAAKDTVKLSLAGARPEMPAITAYWNAKMGLLLVADRLPSPANGRTLQLWFAPLKSAPLSIGALRPDQNGRLFAVFPPNAAVGPLGRLNVTEEPAGGSVRPTPPVQWTAPFPITH
jgi:hypothetical protein